MSYDTNENPPSPEPSSEQKSERRMIDRIIKNGRYKAIIKEVGDRRMLVGFERASKRSRKHRIKYITKPIDMVAMNPIEPVSPEPVRCEPPVISADENTKH